MPTRPYLEENDRPVSVRFVEQRVRGTQEYSCKIEVVQLSWRYNRKGEQVRLHAGAEELAVVCPMGSSWEEAKQKYPTLDDILNRVGTTIEFGRRCVARNFQIQRMEGHEGLYPRPPGVR